MVIYSCFWRQLSSKGFDAARYLDMGTWLVRVGPGEFKGSPVPDSRVVHLLNAGMKICSTGPTISDSERTGVTGMRVSSTDKKPPPSPDK